MKKRHRPVYEGKAKKLYKLEEGMLLMVFKDEVTAFDGRFKDTAVGKGALSASLSSKMFEILEESGISTHYVCYNGDRGIVVKEYKVLPIEVIVRNYAYGSLLRRLPLFHEMEKLNEPIVELHYKDDRLHDPLILPADAIAAGLLDRGEIEVVENLALKVNEILLKFWLQHGLKLVDFKIEIARSNDGMVVVDEVSGDTMRLVDNNNKHLDKEIYRRTRNVEELIRAYRRLAELAGPPRRLCRDYIEPGGND